MRQLKVAIVHDWMVSPGGAEKVVLELHKIWPKAPIYTAAYEPSKFPEFADADVRPTWLNRIKLAKTKHQLFTIPRAWAFKTLNLSDYDLVISSSSAESKYVKTGPSTAHICYCHTPVRYYWSDYDWYRKHPPFGKLNPLAGLVLPFLIGTLRRMDYKAAQKVDYYLANSANVQARIKRYYGRDSEVVYPPIETGSFTKPRTPKDYYLIVGRQVAYKRLDLAVDAFNKLGLKLKVAGSGEEINRQKARSKPNIEYLGFVSGDELADLYAGAKGFIFPPEEDFGIAPVEAMSAGCPVIAYAKGGALEYVIEGETGVLFKKQTPQDLIDAVKRLQGIKFDEKKIRRHAKQFDRKVFIKKIRDFVSKVSVSVS
ncbi:MAG TPA: glycosyltransferase [Candidatus Dormibacteraeota bacterium]|nr:glycosyltransferase [Candidatus Dormibacteraeota bacterium]